MLLDVVLIIVVVVSVLSVLVRVPLGGVAVDVEIGLCHATLCGGESMSMGGGVADAAPIIAAIMSSTMRLGSGWVVTGPDGATC